MSFYTRNKTTRKRMGNFEQRFGIKNVGRTTVTVLKYINFGMNTYQ